MSSMDLVNEGNTLFLDEQFSLAFDKYSQAIKLDQSNVEAYVRRSMLSQKMSNYQDSLNDANKAIEINSDHAKAWEYKGIAEFSLELYGDAKSSFERANELSPSPKVNTWIRKCVAELDDDESSEEVESPISTQPQQVNVSTQPQQVNNNDNNQQEQSQIQQQQKIKFDWYQTADVVSLTIFAKGVKASEAKLDLNEDSVDVLLKGINGTFEKVFDLCGDIVPEESKMNVLSTKVEIKMKKKEFVQWQGLEKSEGRPVTWQAVAEEKKESVRVYPSSKSYNDWDKIASTFEDDKKDGEAGLQQVFQQIYKGATDEQRRAMMKSFYESNGTVLSTNWEDVKTKKVEPTPPEGMEMKYYNR